MDPRSTLALLGLATLGIPVSAALDVEPQTGSPGRVPVTVHRLAPPSATAGGQASVMVAAAPAAPLVGAVTEEATLNGSTVDAGDQAGFSVAVEGDRVVVGAPKDEIAAQNPGKAFAFAYDGTAWNEEASMNNIIAFQDINFGASCSLSDDMLLVGAPNNEGAFFSFQEGGSVDVFFRTGSAWNKVQLFKSGADFAELGHSVSVSPDSAAMGAPSHNLSGNDVGLVGFFDRIGQTLSQTGYAFGLNDGDRFGESVSCDGDTIVVGAPGDDTFGDGAGAGYVFERSASVWSLQGTLSASDIAAGDGFGSTVAVEGDTVFLSSGSAAGGGAVYVFDRTGTTWTETVKLTGSDTAAGDNFGFSLALNGDQAWIGAPLHDGAASNAGATYLVERSGGVWSETLKLEASNPAAGEGFGSSVDADGDLVVIGARLRDEVGVDSGTAFVFRLSGGAVSYCTAGTSASGCQALLSASGSASATAASGFDLAAAGVEGSKDGLFFFGTNGRQANPWGSGTSFQCVVPPVTRAGLLTGSGTNGACDGAFTQDLNALWCPACLKPTKNPGAGATVQAQLWYRDPANTSNQTTSLSDALEFTVQP